MIDIAFVFTHNEAFPSRLLAANGGGHIFDIELTADHDNGELVGRGDYIKLGTYKEAAAPTFAGKIVEQAANGNWYVEVTEATEALWILMPEITPYDIPQTENPKAWVNKTGDVVKGYSLVKGDIFEMSVEGFQGTPAVGKTVSFADGKYVVAA